MLRVLRLVSAALALSTCGCSFFQRVTVEPLATASHRPSNVAAYVAVSDGEVPLDELTPSSFNVYEDEQLVAPEQSQLTLLARDLVAAHQLVLLVDMTEARTPELRQVLAKATLGFVQQVTQHQPVTVLAFDGRPTPVQIANVARGGPQPSMAALENFQLRDGSRDLNGALLFGLAKLDAALTRSGKPVRVGLLVVFASGPDRAGRVDADKTHDLVWSSPHDVLGIAVGLGPETDQLESLSRRGVVRAQAGSTLPIAFEEAAATTRAELEKHYLVSYCSPARAGERRLRLEVSYTTQQGDERKGSFEHTFSAKSFGPDCSSSLPPPFTFQPKPMPKPESEIAPRKPGSNAPERRPSGPSAPSAERDAPASPPPGAGHAE
jgi:hypothetical protein